MGIAPRALVAPPPRLPLPYGLFSTFTFRTGDRWEGGVTWESVTCYRLSGVGEIDCPPETLQPPWPSLPPYVPTFPPVTPPGPDLLSLDPAEAPVGVAVQVEIAGDNFTEDSTVEVDGQPVTTTFVSSTLLTIEVTPEEPGTVEISVETDGVTTDSLEFVVDEAAPAGLPPDLTHISPNFGTVGVALVTGLTANGQELVYGSVIVVDGVDQVTKSYEGIDTNIKVENFTPATVGPLAVQVRNPAGQLSPVTLTFDSRAEVAATGAVAGAPGTFAPEGATAPRTAEDLRSLTADPATAWAEGQWVQSETGAKAYWDGSAWQTGQAPAADGGAK